ncbi:unnamed protein product, partial [Symbiodinium pilosum]
MAAARCETCGLGIWSPPSRCEGCRTHERLNSAIANRTWTAHTWRAVGMAMAAIVAVADGPGKADRWWSSSRRRSPARSESSTPPPPAPGRDGPAAEPPVVERAAADGRGRDEAWDRAVPAVGRAVADGRGRDEARDRAVLAERGHPAGNGKGGGVVAAGIGEATETLEHYSELCLTDAYTALCRGAQRSWRPMASGRRERVGEAANPGPPAADSRGAPSALEVQRQCAAEALARAGLPPFPPLLPEAVSPCGMISDTASQATDLAYLTPRAAGGDLTPLTLPDARTPDEAPSTPVPVQPLPAQARSRWQRGPPAEGPLPPNSWIYIPLLLNGAGSCAQRPQLVGRPPEDWASACRALLEQPAQPLTLTDATRAAAGADGYLTAATQSAFLQAYGGVGVAAEAAALAERARAALPAQSRRNPRRRRRAHAPRAPTAPDGASGSVAAGEAPEPGVDRCRVTRHATGNLPWADVDQIDLQAELRRPVPTLQNAPPFLRAGVCRALVFALRAIRNADAAENAHVTPARPWSLFLLTPRMLLARPGLDGAAGRRLLLERVDRYERGEWLALLAAAQRARSTASRTEEDAEAALRQRREATCRLVRKGEISRARHLLTSGTLAPGDEATWEALTDPAKRPAQARTPVPDELLHCQPEEPARITARAIAQTLREARRGAAPGLSGARAEHFKLLLSDADGLELLMHAASVLAQARVPPAVAAALALARMTALQKPDGGVRGIATADVFCR